jgi:hypothetical protein
MDFSNHREGGLIFYQVFLLSPSLCTVVIQLYIDKKTNKIFLIYREIESGAVAKSYMRKGFPIYEETRKYFPIYEEAVSHI